MSTAWLDDPDLLQAALEIVDTWDVDPSRTSPLTTASCTSDEYVDCHSSDSNSSWTESPRQGVISRLPPLVVTPTRVESSDHVQPSTKASTHHRRRKEIELLRREQLQLEHALLALEHRKRLQFEESQHPNEHDRTRVSMWRDIALRQRHHRTVAESEQNQLREKMKAHVKVAEGLVKLIQRARRLEEEEMLRSPKRQRITSGPTMLLDDDEAIDDVPMDLQAYFVDPGLGNALEKAVKLKIMTDQSNQIVFHLNAAWTVPFGLDEAQEALWKCNIRRHEENWCSPDFVLDAKIRVNDNELVSHFTAVATVGSESGHYNGRAIVKRFAGQTTPPSIVTNFSCVPSSSSPHEFTGVSSREKSWFMIVPLTLDTNLGDDSPVSRIQFTQLLTVACEDNDNARHQAGLMTNILQTKLPDAVDMMQEAVESLLLTMDKT